MAKEKFLRVRPGENIGTVGVTGISGKPLGEMASEFIAACEGPKQKSIVVCDSWCGHPPESDKCWCDKGKI